MASLSARPVSLGGRAPEQRGFRFRPVEGWESVLLHAVLVGAAAWSAERAGWSGELTWLPLISTIGALFGLLLAKTRLPDLLAHIVSFAVAGGFAALVTARQFPELGAGYEERLRVLWQEIQVWYDLLRQGRQVDDPILFVLLLAAMVWLVAYLSAWTLYRRRWMLASVLLPGLIILLSIGYSEQAGSAPLTVYLLAACTLGARHHAFRRQSEWRRAQIPAPTHLPWRFLRAGGVVTALAVIIAWGAPLTAKSEYLEPYREVMLERLDQLEARWDQWFSWINRPNQPDGEQYSSFEDSFRLGGPLNLTDEPQLLVQADDPTYLAAYRYDRYDGHGWSSDIEGAFDPVAPDGQRYSPELTFQANQEVLLTDAVTGARTPTDTTVQVLLPRGDLMVTTDTYLSSELPTSVRLSWRSLQNEAFPILTPSPGVTTEVPVDLRRLAVLLERASFDPGMVGQRGNPMPLDSQLAEQIVAERRALESRFLETSWDVVGTGAVGTLYVSGQLPVYNDVAAVLAQDDLKVGESYAVTGLESTAAPDAVRAAGNQYPRYVIDRYLRLPTTVTDRTRVLASEIAAPQDNALDIAVAVQNHLRTRIAYREDIEVPPENQDVVDYVLFDSQEGYCEYYASAMVVMLRTLGIPARAVVGYFPVQFDEAAGGFLYRERNAHAWVEAYFPGYGWLPFEPTASQAPRNYDSTPPPSEPESPTPTPSPTPSPTPVPPTPTPPPPGQSPVPTLTPTPMPTSTPEPTPDTVTPPLEQEPPSPSLLDRLADQLALLGMVTASLLFLLVVLFVAYWMWTLRDLSPASGLYARALRLGRWWGVRATPTMTPAEYAEALGRAVPNAIDPARRVASAYMIEQYGGAAAQERMVQEGRNAWHQLRRILAGALFRRRRR